VHEKEAKEAARRRHQVRLLFIGQLYYQTISQQAETTAKRQAERAKAFTAPEESAAPDVKEKRKKKRKRDETET